MIVTILFSCNSGLGMSPFVLRSQVDLLYQLILIGHLEHCLNDNLQEKTGIVGDKSPPGLQTT
jgi:hypothetical protein